MKILLLNLCLLLGCVVQGEAQLVGIEGACKLDRTAPPTGAWTWAAGTHVDVYIRIPDFAEKDVAALLTAVQNWDASYNENGSGVRFGYQGTVREAMTCSNCLTIIRGDTTRKQHGAELQAFSKREDQIIDYAWIIVNPRYKKSQTLTSIVAHELGHSLGLMDCFNCERGSSAMNRFNVTVSLLQMKIIEWSNGIKGPTVCDLSQVRKAYQDLKIFVHPSPTDVSTEASDEGEEPEADDTPVIESARPHMR